MNSKLFQSSSRRVIRALKLTRHCAYLALSPLDYLSRAVNDKLDFPPIHLRRYVGPLRTFESSGAEFMSYLRLIARLRSDESVLDIGCGCGQMALQLKAFLDAKTRYVGVDLHQPSIRWCLRTISASRPNFAFLHVDVKNGVFNPKGTQAAETLLFPYRDTTFDVILLKSVFTHMRPSEVDNYLREISRLLSENGRCLATLFLLNQRQQELDEQSRNKLRFQFGNETWRYVYSNSPESAAAFQETYILDLLAKHGLKLAAPVMYGTWSGSEDGLSFQDMLLIERQ